MEFHRSDPHTIGMELELQLLDSQTLDLVDSILPLIEFYPDSELVKPEFIQNTVEVASKVCKELEELETSMIETIRGLKKQCVNLGMTLCGAGSHPFCEKLALITPLPRYQVMEKTAGYLGHNQITYATHVHIGMRTGNEAIMLMHKLKAFLPLLIALSANSPYWRGYDTGYAAYRHRILAAARSFGIPPSFKNWGEFEVFLKGAMHAGIFQSVNDIHWDIRPRPVLGTLEIRVMDAQSKVKDAVAIACFIRSLVSYFRHPGNGDHVEAFPRPLPWWIEKENHYQASRQGLNASLVIDETGRSTKMRNVLLNVCDVLRPIAVAKGEACYFDHLLSIVDKGPGYVIQKDYRKQGKDFYGIVAALVARLNDEING
ncbi:MAG: YbdK family carboxylate-amine ligase [Gammaproteobacteria bacterium]